MKRGTLSGLVLAIALIVSTGVPLLVVLLNTDFPITFTDLFYIAGKYFGLAAFFVLSFQYLWTAKLRIFERLRSYDGRVAVHRTMGFLGILLLSLHPILILGTYAIWGVGLTVTLPIGLGFLAFFVLLVISGSTFLGRIWRVRYEVWKRIHWLTFPVLTVSYIHSRMIGSDINGGFGTIWFVLWLLHLGLVLGKITHKIVVWSKQYQILKIDNVKPDITTIEMEKTAKKYLPGQFAFISLKQKGRWKEWHPFSLTSHPGEDTMSMAIKAVGDFTQDLKNTETAGKIKIDGPYGAFSSKLAPSERYVFVAGGIGITPIISILKELKQDGLHREVTLLYCVRHENDIIFREELESWFSLSEKWQIHLVCSGQKDFSGIKGRLTPELLYELCDGQLDATFFLCGPAGLVGAIQSALRREGVPKRRIIREQFVFLP